MKTRLLKLSLLLIVLTFFFGCCKECKKDQERYKELTDINKDLFPTPENGRIEQDFIPIGDINSQDNQRNRYEAYGKIDLNSKKLEINIPITDSKLKIVNYKIISSKKLKALLIVLDGNGGKETSISPGVGIIKKTYDLNKVKFDFPDENQKLIVYVLHEDNYQNIHSEKYRLCVNQIEDYEEYQSCLNAVKPFPKKPNEDGGDIITGG